MNRALFLLAFAALILAPDNPVGMVVLFLMACLKVWRTHDIDVEVDDFGGGAGSGAIDQSDVFRDCDLK